MNGMMIATRGVAMALVLSWAATIPAAAQGGFLRRAKETVTRTVESTIGGGTDEAAAATATSTGGAASTTPAASGSTRKDPRLLTMDAAVMDRFARAIDAEISTRDEWVAFEEEFVRCQGTMYTDPAILEEISRLSDRMSNVQGDGDALVKASQEYQAGMDALVKKHCGVSQSEYGEKQGRVNEDVMRAALDAGQFNDGQYALLKERFVPFCEAGGASASVAGPEGDDFYVYSAEEVATIGPRCESLMPRLAKTL